MGEIFTAELNVFDIYNVIASANTEPANQNLNKLNYPIKVWNI